VKLLNIRPMRVLKSLSAVTTYPTGSKSFAVQQGFPQPISAEEADPFLMCDHFVRSPHQNPAPRLFCAPFVARQVAAA
jgi:hypothetical protein